MASPVLDNYLDGFVRGFFPFFPVAEYCQLKVFWSSSQDTNLKCFLNSILCHVSSTYTLICTV